MTTLWDTTGSAVVKELAAQRRTGGAVLSGVALTLIVVADESRVNEAEEAATHAAEMHPCRVLVVVRRQIDAPAPRLDAEVVIGGRLGPGEAVVMRMYGRLGLHAESVVLPLLAADAPVVAWWHAAPPDQLATDALAVFADRRITDSSIAEDPLTALKTRAKDYAPGDTDLAWTRLTLWRSMLAAALDQARTPVTSAVVEAEADNPAAELLARWLEARLRVRVERVVTDGPVVTAVRLGTANGEIVIDRPEGPLATMTLPGQPPRSLALKVRATSELIAEELRRLDADEMYAVALRGEAGKETPVHV
jgi:glucose-6-phosphate dehydrogenase assembly protein OpcA